MEAKLKALKVTDLKDLLNKSGTPIPSKANKADLIAKILASPDALKLVEGNAEAPKGGDDELLAPPDEFDWESGADASKAAPAETATTTTTDEALTAEAPEETAATVEEVPTEGATEGATASVVPETTGDSAPAEESAKTPEEIELERRKARAARFGIPLVEDSSSKEKGPRAPRAKGRTTQTVADGTIVKDKTTTGATIAGRGGNQGKASATTADAGKTNTGGGGNKSAEGQSKPVKISSKEAAPVEDDEKLAARAARFNIAGPSQPVDSEEDKRKKREARFGNADSTSKKAKTDA